MAAPRCLDSELVHKGGGLRAQDKSVRQSPERPRLVTTPDPPAAACESPPAFSYELYCDEQGHFSYDGAALALVKRPSHLQRVYADAAHGEARPKQLVQELEYWFQQTGIAVADRTAALGCRVLPELQSDCRPPNWGFIEQLLGNTPESSRLREVLAEAYARRALQLEVRNDVIVTSVNLLLVGSLAKAVLARAGVVEARTTARQSLAPEAGVAGRAPRAIDPNKLNHIFGKAEHALDDFVRASGGSEQAFTRIQDAANTALREGRLVPGPNGVLPGGDAGPIIDVGGTQIRLIGGRVVDGVVEIGSVSRRGLP